MNKLLTLIAAIFFCNISNAHVSDTLICDYPDRDTIQAELLPWFGNNDYLEDFLDSIGYPAANTSPRIIGSTQVRYHVPIKFWVYRNNAGVGGPNLEQLQSYIDNLNRFYNVDNNTLIGFYMKCEIGFIDNDNHVVIDNKTEGENLAQNNKERGCINIHIVDELYGNLGVHYRARFYGIDGIFLSSATYQNADFAATIAHEVGHYFELDHTHQYSSRGRCRKEAIDRNRNWPFFTFCPFSAGGTTQRVCESTGDFLRDTPADHDLSDNNSCNYAVTGQTDPWGDSYAAPPAGSLPPDARNIMSYNRMRVCREVFSRLQIAVMLYSIERGKSKSNRSSWKDMKAEYDEYEPDNHSLSARVVNFGEIQERNFHQQILGEIPSGAPIWSQCDVDWVSFTPSCSGSFEIRTSAMPGRANADTRLTLFNVGLTQLAQNDDISGSNKYSSIVWNFVSGNEYFIRVENRSTTLQTVYYRLQVGVPQISGTNSFCTTSSAYTIANLPSGATVSWGVSPAGIATPATPSQSSTTLTKATDGIITLTATITNACGASGPIIVNKSNIVVGFPTYLGPTGPDIAWPNGNYYYSVNLPIGYPPASSYFWKVPTGWTILSGQGTNNLYVRTGVTSGAVEVQVTACGITRPTFKFVEIGSGPYWPDGGGDTQMGVSALYPNPAENTVTINWSNDIKPVHKSVSSVIITFADITGQTKKRLNYSTDVSQAHISIHDLPPGNYVVTIASGEQVVRKKLVIRR